MTLVSKIQPFLFIPFVFILVVDVSSPHAGGAKLHPSVFSVFGLQVLVYILAVIGWVIVTGTLILCGVVLVFHNVVADTCVAMEEWVLHPHAHTALDDILPCVDTSTAIESMNQSEEVTFQLVTIVNRATSNISNVDYPPMIPPPVNYNQSGPSVPPLCNPYMPDMSDRECLSGELTLANATEVWKSYVCNTITVNGNEICTTVGRLTPDLYNEFSSAVRVSRGIYDYSPFLAQLADCTFARETFTAINSNNCPALSRYSRWLHVGLALISGAVMLSLIFSIIYTRERRHWKYNKQFIVESDQQPFRDSEKA